MSCVLGVLTRPEVEVEAKLYQVRNVTGFCGYPCGHDGVDDEKGEVSSCFAGGSLMPYF